MRFRCCESSCWISFNLCKFRQRFDERARELWFEGHRRNDMIRWGTFLNPKELKTSESDPKYLLYPIPADALLNPNMSQNPGY